MLIHKVTMQEKKQTFTVPLSAMFISSGQQNGAVVLWYAFDNEQGEPTMPVHVTAVGTGEEFDSSQEGLYFETVQMPNGLVWHLFIDTMSRPA